MSCFVIWKDGKPVAASDTKEAKRLAARATIIDKVLKEMGYLEGYAKYNEYVQEMATTDFKKYMEFLKRVDELAAQQGA